MRASSACRALALVAALSTTLTAQTNPASTQSHRLGANRLTVDAAYSRVWLRNTAAGAELPMNAATGRLSWRLGQPALFEDAPLRDKLALGVFWTQAPEQQRHSGRVGFSHVGGFAEYMPMGVIGLGFFEPNLSLSLGAFRPEIVHRNRLNPTPLITRSVSRRADLGIQPGVGTRIWLFRKVGLRVDAHDLIVPSARSWSNDFGISAGVTARF